MSTPDYDGYIQREPDTKDREAFADYFEDWGDKIFFDWLERSVWAYQDLVDLLAPAVFPALVKDLSPAAGEVLLGVAKSQDKLWEQFEEWAFQRWSNSHD